MPGFEALTAEELLAVVLYERSEFGGEDLVEAGILDEEGELVPGALDGVEGPKRPARDPRRARRRMIRS